MSPNLNLRELSFLVYGLGHSGQSVVKFFKRNKIKNYKKGFYIHFKFEGNKNTLSEIEKKLKIDGSIIRYLTVKYKKLDTQAEIIEDIRRNNARINSEAERSIRRNSVFGRLPNHRSQRRGRGSIDFNIGFGNKRNRGNINIFKGW